MSELPVLYSFRRCPFAMRARLVLAACGVAVEIREVALRAKPAALLQASPKATVPVLVLANGQVIAESLEIMRWGLSKHDPHHWLRAEGGSATAPQNDSLIADCDQQFKPLLDRCKYPARYQSESGPATANRESDWVDAFRWLQTMEARLATNLWLVGNTASLTDAALFPFVRQFAAIDPARWNAMRLPRLKIWLGAWMSSALFAGAMEKLVAWQPGDPAITRYERSAATGDLPQMGANR